MTNETTESKTQLSTGGWGLILVGSLSMLGGVVLHLDSAVSYLGLVGAVAVAAGLQLKDLGDVTRPGEGPRDVL